MTNLPITVACWDYDRTRPLLDGRVRIAGCAATFHTMPIEEMFARAFTRAEFDVTALSFSHYMARLARGDSASSPLPVSPSRRYRHPALFLLPSSCLPRPQTPVRR